jgi:hypothetical protein
VPTDEQGGLLQTCSYALHRLMELLPRDEQCNRSGQVGARSSTCE